MASIDFDPEDYVDEIGTRFLIRELKSRKVLPKSFPETQIENEAVELQMWSKTPKRDAMIEFLKLSSCATLEDIIEEVKQIFNK